ncbi:hypothetical protein ACFQ7F_16215 [Streptomyces sp. NPDC056486]
MAAYAAYAASEEPTVTVELENGRQVTIAGVSPDEAQRLVEQLLDRR